MITNDQEALRARPLTRGRSFAALATAVAVAGCTGSTSDDAPPATPAPSVAPAAPVLIRPHPGTVRLPRAEHPLARPEFELGRLAPERHIANLSLFFGLSAEQRKERDALVAAQLDPASPSYHRWLTPELYRRRFGARPEDVARASQWLVQQGLEVHRVSPLGTRLTFSARVADLEAAFQTEMHRYGVGGEIHYAMATAPAMPDDLAPAVLAVYNTHDFYPRPASRLTNAAAFARRTPTAPQVTINYDAGPGSEFQVLGPPDWAAAYDVARLYSPGIGGKALDGTGVTIGIVGTALIAQADLNAFRKTFNLPQQTVTMTVVPNTGRPLGGQGGAGTEAILDVEWSGGIAKGASVQYVYVGQDDQNVDDATFYLIEENLAPILSESWGGCEAGSLESDADVLEENGTAANLLGITYLAAAGDAGGADCWGQGYPGLYVDMPGSFPGVTAVGGTQFPSPAWSPLGSLLDAGLEQVWNELNNPYATFQGYPMGVGAGGGGISSVFSRPAYQAGVGACAPNGALPVPSTKPMRQVPDVAVSAASQTPGYFIECTFDFKSQDCSATGGAPFSTPIGGTSAATPSFAGVVAILNQAVGERLGNINPVLYQLGSAAGAAAPFHDITSGNNEIVCGAAGAADAGGPDGGVWPDVGCGTGGLYGYAATTGYDCASGLGSIDAFNLVEAWLGAVKTSTVIVPTPAATTAGADVTLSATVSVDGSSAHVVTGNVTFAFESHTAKGATDLSWELGTAPIVNGTTTGGGAVLVTKIPPGLVNPGHQQVDVVAVYSGDTDHLPSTSARASVSFAPLSFVIDPATLAIAPNGTHDFVATGGVAPVRWFVTVDTTASYTRTSSAGSSIAEKSGAFVAGPVAGYVEIAAVDADGAESIAEITVGSPGTAAPWGMDAGVDSGVRDAGRDGAGNDAGPSVRDSGHPRDALADHSADVGILSVEPGGGGCTCTVVSGGKPEDRSPLGWLVGLLVGVAATSRRRRGR